MKATHICIPANQSVKKGEKFKITLDKLLSVYLRATEDTSSASYDTLFYAHDFNPYRHGFKGMNAPLCILIESMCDTNTHVAEYLIEKVWETV